MRSKIFLPNLVSYAGPLRWPRTIPTLCRPPQAPTRIGEWLLRNFYHGVDNVPNLTKVLEVLEIETTSGHDFTNIKRIYMILRTSETVFECAQISGNYDWLRVTQIAWTLTWPPISHHPSRNCRCATLVHSPSFTTLMTGSSIHRTRRGFHS